MKKRVEIYFVIYLSALISILAIEGELKRYKDNQKNILDKIAEEKATSIVEVNSTDNSDGETVNLRLEIYGDFEFADGKKLVLFINEDNDTTETFMETEEDNELFYVKIPKRRFNQNNTPHNVVLNFDIIPNISESTRDKWGLDYGDFHIADKLIELINNKGKININRKIDMSITPKIGEVAKFVLNGAGRINVIRGVPWNHEIFPGGIKTADGYQVNAVPEQENVTINKVGIRKIIIAGVSYQDEDVTIRGIRRDGDTDQFSFEVIVIEPRWDDDPPGPDEVCINEPLELNCSINRVESSRISVILSGLRDEKIDGSIVKLDGLNRAGILIVDVFIDNNINDRVKSYTVNVIQPSAPTAEIISNECNVIKVALTAYCTGNEITGMYSRRGIKNIMKMETIELPSKTISYYTFTVKEPNNRIAQREIQFIFEDKNDTRVDTSMTTMYQYVGCP